MSLIRVNRTPITRARSLTRTTQVRSQTQIIPTPISPIRTIRTRNPIQATRTLTSRIRVSLTRASPIPTSRLSLASRATPATLATLGTPRAVLVKRAAGATARPRALETLARPQLPPITQPARGRLPLRPTAPPSRSSWRSLLRRCCLRLSRCDAFAIAVVKRMGRHSIAGPFCCIPCMSVRGRVTSL